MATWAGWGNTAPTRPSYVADRYLAFGYEGQLADLLSTGVLPIGDLDLTRPPPCQELLGWRYVHPGQPPITRGAVGAVQVSHPMPGPAQLVLFYAC